MPYQSEYVLDLGSEDFVKHQQLASREKLAESLRLLYVALTRARHRCYLVWGGFKDAGFSAPAWLFHRPPVLSEDLRASMDSHFKNLTEAQLQASLARLASASVDANGQKMIQVTPIPREPPPRYVPPTNDSEQVKARVFDRAIPRNWRITSFSMLTADAREEKPDYDPVEQEATPHKNEQPATGIFAFPRGTTPGTCLHKIFEQLDFTATDPEQLAALVEDKLRSHGFGKSNFGPAVCEALRRTMAVTLDPSIPELTLSRITPAERLNELEFYLPIHDLSPALLKSGFLGDTGDSELASTLERLGFTPSGGFMKGYIDLVFRFGERFYIADWKSNWLGNQPSDYQPSALGRVMERKFYRLQYHLYTIALHQYLATRLPDYRYERHFGGVFYLFVRGIDPAQSDLGVFRDRPSAQLIKRLSQLLVAPAAQGEAG